MNTGVIASTYVRNPPRPMILKINTTYTSVGSTDANTFRIPTRIGYSYYYRVDWDGEVVTRGHTGDAEYTFDTAGEKTIKIYGVFSQFYFNNGGDRLKIMSIDAWGDVQYSSDNNMINSFYGASNLYYISDGASWFDSLTNGIYMFRDNSLTSLPEGMTLSNLTNGIGMFNINKLTSLPDGMTLNSLTSGTNMFRDNFLTSLPEGMTLSNLTIGSYMFYSNNLTTLPEGMTLSSLTNGSFMFYGNTINTARYSQLLIDMEASNPNDNVTFHGGYSKYNSSAVAARANLVARGWTITDGGLE